MKRVLSSLVVFLYFLANGLSAQDNPLEPYFLPDEHPIRSQLDHLFQKHRATASLESFKLFGFSPKKVRTKTNAIVATHPRFKGFVFKVYLDSQPPLCEWKNWLQRIEGANAIRECIEKYGFEDIMTVPKKWIYPLPTKSDNPQQKNFILIAEDMNILSHKDNLKAYRHLNDTRLLDALFCVFSEVGLLDSVYPDNIPFTKSGKIAFIDTEHHHHPVSSIPYHKLTSFLSKKMGAHWEALIEGVN